MLVFFFLSVFTFPPRRSQPPHLSALHLPNFCHPLLQHQTLFTLPSVLHCVGSGWCHGVSPSLLFISPLHYMCYSLRPAIGILLTLACLIRERQKERKTKASPFCASLHMPSPSSQCLWFSLPLPLLCQLHHREIVLIDLLKGTWLLTIF